ncbi:MAG: LuxR C-terminal-related transcriptional regulator [Hyphomicrobiales bacterium]|jgi:DNA-binding CsgD family transcriptional regulator
MNSITDPLVKPDIADLLSAAVAGHTMQRVRTPDGKYSYSYVSDGIRDGLGLDPDLLMNAQAVDHSWLHPEDRLVFIDALEASAAKLSQLDEEVRVKAPGGGYRWVRSIGSPRRLDDGTVIWDGVALDVTDRRQAVDALQKALLQVRASETSETRFSQIAALDVSERLHDLERAIKALPPSLSAAVELNARFDDFKRSLSAARDLVENDEPAARHLPAGDPPGHHERESLKQLTAKQRQVLAVMSEGYSNQQIAEELGITIGTVKLHISAILKRLAARNRTHAAQIWNGSSR